MASPTDQLDKKWKSPPFIIPTLRTVTDSLSTSSADDPDPVHAARDAANEEGLAPGRSPCLTPRLVPTTPSPGTPSTLIATPE
eukprot:8819287-Pyramimonas_sp.AAC.1